ncbi:uncharacterized protein LOC119661872 [Teleopsis dalmanni]|uniref:uncharacterized protein LOC119661872 n=1 Tax=Teleopsis dalmanni TaxID=139649 RepID=UPI0018CEC850|nr:uncharacterized protein LOC119661872 [Teleopsis dalmanni]
MLSSDISASSVGCPKKSTTTTATETLPTYPTQQSPLLPPTSTSILTPTLTPVQHKHAYTHTITHSGLHTKQTTTAVTTKVPLSSLQPATTIPTSTTDTNPKNTHTLLLETLDMLLSCLVVAPCVIAYWRGTWELMGVLIFPNNVPLSALCSFLIGGLGHLLFTLTQTFFKDHIHPDKRRLTYYVISRCYTAIFGIVCVNMWRGSWVLCDWLTSVDSLVIISVVTLVAMLFLIATRTVRNLGAAPYTVTMDHKSDYFEVDTMFKIPGFNQPGLYLLDSLFSIFVIGTLVVIAWRGLWGIMDLTFYPSNKAKSAWGSLLIGYATVFLTFVIQPLIRCICKKINGLCRLLICDIFYFLTFFGAVNAWRGIWNLLDVYLYPDNRILSFWLTHVIPFLILAALKCSNSILVRGVFIDAEGHGGECVDLPINYVKLHFERERTKKVYVLHQHYRQHHLARNMEKEAQSSLIDKPHKTEVQKQNIMESSHLV